jgi:hypothetical protein
LLTSKDLNGLAVLPGFKNPATKPLAGPCWKHLTSHDWALIEVEPNEATALIAAIAKSFFIFLFFMI